MRIEAGDRTVRTESQRADELGHVAQALDELTERLDASSANGPSYEHERGRCSRASATICARRWRALRAAVEALADGVAPEPERYLRSMQRDVEALSALVDDLFLLARIEAGRLDLRRVPVDLAELADEAVEALRPAAAARRGAIVLGRPAVPRSSATPLRSGGSSATSSTTPSTTRRSGSTVRVAVDDDDGRPSVRSSTTAPASRRLLAARLRALRPRRPEPWRATAAPVSGWRSPAASSRPTAAGSGSNSRPAGTRRVRATGRRLSSLRARPSVGGVVLLGHLGGVVDQHQVAGAIGLRTLGAASAGA